MTARLTDNLALLTGAPNGIKRLRELILELAMRGKLVPQSRQDEPASELLKRIAEETLRFGSEGSNKKQKEKQLTEINPGDRPFNVPSNWEWVHVSTIGHDWGQKNPDQEFTYIDVGAVDNIAGVISSPKIVAAMDAPSRARKIVKSGTIIYSTVRPYLLNVAVVGESYEKEPIASTAFAIIHPYLDMPSRYFFWCLRSPIFVRYVESIQIGVAYPAINDTQFFSGLIPLPPVAEQHRIVAKVDELMALCERLEAQQARTESAHAQMVQVLLYNLTQASDDAEFADNWQRLAEHLPTMFTTEPSIDALKQNLLQLAVMGKVVPQDYSDEPASELLKRIADEKARLVAEGELKKQKPLAEITKAELPFAIPNNWAWSRIGELVLSTEYGLSEKTSDLQDGVPVLKMGDIQGGQVVLGGQMKVSKEAEGMPELYLEPEDLLYNRTNSAELVGKTGLFLGPSNEFTFASYLIRIRCMKSLFSPAYLNISMNTPGFRESQINPHLKQQCGQANVNGTIMKNMLVSVPPLREQHRIVAKLDQLMALCDQLKSRLTEARQLSEQLVTTLIEHALAEDSQQHHVAMDQKATRTLLAAEITHRLHGQRTFGQRKLQKVIYLAEHVARLAAIQGSYLRNVAGPHDRQLMNQVEGELKNCHWYECIKRETVGHAYRPLALAGQHRQAYNSAWSAPERATIEQVIELMRDWDTDRCEMTVTLYAVWNDFILEDRPATDEAIVDEVMHRWNDAKLRFSKTEWLAVLADMKKHEILMPTGFGKRTTGGILSLPGFE